MAELRAFLKRVYRGVYLAGQEASADRKADEVAHHFESELFITTLEQLSDAWRDDDQLQFIQQLVKGRAFAAMRDALVGPAFADDAARAATARSYLSSDPDERTKSIFGDGGEAPVEPVSAPVAGSVAEPIAEHAGTSVVAPVGTPADRDASDLPSAWASVAQSVRSQYPTSNIVFVCCRVSPDAAAAHAPDDTPASVGAHAAIGGGDGKKRKRTVEADWVADARHVKMLCLDCNPPCLVIPYSSSQRNPNPANARSHLGGSRHQSVAGTLGGLEASRCLTTELCTTAAVELVRSIQPRDDGAAAAAPKTAPPVRKAKTPRFNVVSPEPSVHGK